MSGVLRLANTGGATGRSTLEATATSDATFSLPSVGGTLLTSNYSVVGTITLDGSAVNITNGDLNVDSNTLFVDESTNRVGIGTNSPAFKLDCTDTGAFTKNRSNTGGVANCALTVNPGDSTMFYGFRVNQSDNDLVIDSNSLSEAIKFGPTGTATFGPTSGSYVQLAQNTGVTINDGILDLYAASDNVSSKIFKVQSDVGGTKVEKAYITATGAGNFDGSVEAGSIIKSTSDSGFVSKPVSAGAQFAFRATDTGDNVKAKILSDGSAMLEGSLAIGTATAQKKLHVRNDSDSYPVLVQNRTNAVSTCGVALIATGSDFNDGQYATIEALSGGVGSTQHELRFRTCSSGGTPDERIRILANGGLTFNGDTAQANALDDYEEGTWTPVGNSNFNGISNADGAYIKVGRMVIINYQFNFTSLDDSTVVSQVRGLPFSPKNDNPNTGVECTGVCYGDNRLVLTYIQNDELILAFETQRPIQGSASTGSDQYRGTISYMSN